MSKEKTKDKKAFYVQIDGGTTDKIYCEEIVVDKDGILLANDAKGKIIAMYKEWTSWGEEGAVEYDHPSWDGGA